MMSCPKTRRTAFTLVELLVVIAIISVIVSLLLPSIQSARETARRMACKNNVRQLGLAVLNYESAHSALPPGGWIGLDHDCVPVGIGSTDFHCFGISDGFQPDDYPLVSWIVLCLPYFEEQALYDQFDFQKSISDQRQSAVGASIGSLICPSDASVHRLFYDGSGAQSPVRRSGLLFAKANYAAYVSPHHIDLQRYLPGALGGFKAGERRGQRTSRVTDGASKTILAAEVRAIEPEYDHRGVWSLPFPGSTLLALDWHHKLQGSQTWSTLKPGTQFVADPEWTDVAVPNSQSERHPDGLFVCRRWIMKHQYKAPCTSINALMIAAPRSLHPGGVNAVALDGHAGFISNQIDSHTFAYLISINDNASAEVTEYLR